jgi:hypothetical protein
LFFSLISRFYLVDLDFSSTWSLDSKASPNSGDLKASVSSTFNNLPTAKPRIAHVQRLQPSSFSTHIFTQATPTQVLITPQKNESAFSALRQATLSPGAVNTPCAVIALAPVLIGSDGKIPYRKAPVMQL